MDAYYKKSIIYANAGHKFEFDIATSLFSSFDVDHGTDLFIRSITFENPKTILDLGCGYGPIGIVMAAKYPQAQVTMADCNLLALRYTDSNIAKNKIINAKSVGSVGMQSLENQSFDLILSNIPARIGEEGIVEDFLLQPIKHLNKNGEYWFVVVSKLNNLIKRVGKQYKLKFERVRKRRGHTVYKTKRL